MSSKKLPISLNIAMTMKSINQVCKVRIHNQNQDIPSDSVRLLMMVHYNNGLTQQDLSDFFKKDKSTILRQFDAMEELGLMKRSVDSKDRRKSHIMLTKEGLKLINDVTSKEKKIFRELTKGIDASDILTFNRVLLQIRENAELL